MIGQTDVM